MATTRIKEPLPINAPDKFALSDGERSHPLWQRLEAHMKDQLGKLRAQNDKIQTEAETAALRGRIAEVKRIISLGREPQVIE